MSDPVAVPLTPAVAVSVWLFDPVTVVLVGLAALGYWRAWRSAPATDRGGPDGNTSAAAWCFGAGLVLWLLTGCSAIAVIEGGRFQWRIQAARLSGVASALTPRSSWICRSQAFCVPP